MPQILKDMTFLQHTETLKNIVATIAILFGGLWAFYKWSFSEWLRIKKEMPAIDGFLEVKVTPNSSKASFITLIATWKNRSPLPFPIDTNRSGIDIFIIPQSIDIGVIGLPETFGEPLISYKPYIEFSSKTLLPMTDNVEQSHYLLDTNCTYLFRWQLFGSKRYLWRKTLLLNLESKGTE